MPAAATLAFRLRRLSLSLPAACRCFAAAQRHFRRLRHAGFAAASASAHAISAFIAIALLFSLR
jgi:hypothetical protein